MQIFPPWKMRTLELGIFKSEHTSEYRKKLKALINRENSAIYQENLMESYLLRYET